MLILWRITFSKLKIFISLKNYVLLINNNMHCLLPGNQHNIRRALPSGGCCCSFGSWFNPCELARRKTTNASKRQFPTGSNGSYLCGLQHVKNRLCQCISHRSLSVCATCTLECVCVQLNVCLWLLFIVQRSDFLLLFFYHDIILYVYCVVSLLFMSYAAVILACFYGF